VRLVEASAFSPLQKSIGAFLAFVALDIGLVTLIDAVAARLHGHGLATWTIQHTHFPFLLSWAGIAIATVRRRRLVLPWVKPRASIETRHARAFVLAGALVLAAQYAPAACRFFTARLCVPHLALLVETAVLTPLVEEVLFRGILWTDVRRLTASLSGPRSLLATMTITSLAFAAWHLPFPGPSHFAAHALFGVAMAFVRHGLRRLWPCVVCHAVGNVLTTIVYDGIC
jgi:membrane protease YdiL (CAAX protease family)